MVTAQDRLGALAERLEAWSTGADIDAVAAELRAMAADPNGAGQMKDRMFTAYQAALARAESAEAAIERVRGLLPKWQEAWGSPDFTGAAQNTFAHCADELSAALRAIGPGVEDG